jgi:O-antigen ligase
MVFLAVRWIAVPEWMRLRAEQLFMVSGALVATLGIWNRLGPAGWSDWVDSVGLIQFRRAVLGVVSHAAVERVAYGDGHVIRAGSVFLTANDMAYYLLAVIAIAGARMVRRGVRPFEAAVVLVSTLAIFYSFSRSAMALVGLVGVIVAVASGRLSRQAGSLSLAAAIFVAVMTLLGAGGQIASGADAEDERTSAHLDRFAAGVERIVERPLGSGLGTSSATADRFEIEDRVQTENYYLRVGVELGLLGSVLVVALVVGVLRRLIAAAKRDGPSVAGAVAAFGAAAAGALVLENFSELSMAWTVAAIVGFALPAAGAGASRDRGLPAADVSV